MTDPDPRKYSLKEHIIELRRRIIYSVLFFMVAFVGCYYYSNVIYNFLLEPLAKELNPEQHKMIYTGLTEAFFTYIRLSVYAALLTSFPFIATQIYIFIAPALYKNERKMILPYLIMGPLLFILGVVMVYYLVFPMAWKFFLSFESPQNSLVPIKFEARISEYLTLVMQLIMAFGIAFQLPIILMLLTKIGIINTGQLRRKRRLAIVIIFIIAAIITPPDVISQIALAIPMVILYEIAIMACKRIEKSKQDA